jgi:CDP-6-deoxy-D-xylo-4-hexulose-3-dehydrase
MIPLTKDTIDNHDIDALIQWLKTYPRLTKGERTLEYEKQWSEAIGCKYSVFVNSGSSANLLMLYSLIEAGLLARGDKVIVPAVSWSTDLAPLIQLGLEPLLCDCNLDNLSVDLEHLISLILKEKPKALLLVSVLGLVPDMKAINEICNKNNVILLEDVCESLGSRFEDKCLGTFGFMSSFSTYFGHHISTIEGGMICTNDRKIFNLLKSLRSHGWDRDMDIEVQNKVRQKYLIENDFDSLYKFYHFGFNFRSRDNFLN